MPLQHDTNIEELEKHIRDEIKDCEARLKSDPFSDITYIDETFINKQNTLQEIIDLFFTN